MLCYPPRRSGTYGSANTQAAARPSWPAEGPVGDDLSCRVASFAPASSCRGWPRHTLVQGNESGKVARWFAATWRWRLGAAEKAELVAVRRGRGLNQKQARGVAFARM